jgi:hypothetical protein
MSSARKDEANDTNYDDGNHRRLDEYYKEDVVSVGDGKNELKEPHFLYVVVHTLDSNPRLTVRAAAVVAAAAAANLVSSMLTHGALEEWYIRNPHTYTRNGIMVAKRTMTIARSSFCRIQHGTTRSPGAFSSKARLALS